jgi:hypothetical protein
MDMELLEDSEGEGCPWLLEGRWEKPYSDQLLPGLEVAPAASAKLEPAVVEAVIVDDGEIANVQPLWVGIRTWEVAF